MVKTLKNLHQNQESFEAESWYLASVTEGLLSLFSDDHRMTFDIFMTQSDLCPSCCCNTCRMLHGICRYAMTQVSESWPVGLLFYYKIKSLLSLEPYNAKMVLSMYHNNSTGTERLERTV